MLRQSRSLTSQLLLQLRRNATQLPSWLGSQSSQYTANLQDQHTARSTCSHSHRYKVPVTPNTTAAASLRRNATQLTGGSRSFLSTADLQGQHSTQHMQPLACTDCSSCKAALTSWSFDVTPPPHTHTHLQCQHTAHPPTGMRDPLLRRNLTLLLPKVPKVPPPCKVHQTKSHQLPAKKIS